MIWLLLKASVLIHTRLIHVVDACGSDIANAPPTSSAPPVVGIRRASSASLVAGAPIHVSEPESEPDVETLDGGTHRLYRTGAVKWLVLMVSVSILASFIHVVDACGSDIANSPPTSSTSLVVGPRQASSASLVAGTRRDSSASYLWQTLATRLFQPASLVMLRSQVCRLSSLFPAELTCMMPHSLRAIRRVIRRRLSSVWLIITGAMNWLVRMACIFIDKGFTHVVEACGSVIAYVGNSWASLLDATFREGDTTSHSLAPLECLAHSGGESVPAVSPTTLSGDGRSEREGHKPRGLSC